MDDRSPVMWASCLMKLVHPAFCSGGTSAPVVPFATAEEAVEVEEKSLSNSWRDCFCLRKPMLLEIYRVMAVVVVDIW